ncbi:MAG: hypothetical protein LIO46_01740 [Clostridiales bacterium]|nr:hypothetical protein [Clostridiales bacterium]
MAKRPWSRKKKTIVTIVGVVVFLLAAALGGGIYALNWYCAEIEAEEPISVSQVPAVQAGTEVRLIAHRGMSAQAPENTLPAYTLAGEYGYWGAETDIYRTKDGVWVLMHDNYLYRLMEGTFLQKVESMTYEDLMTYVYDNGANIQDYPDLRVCTFEDYLDECLKYGVVPVIEYKSSKNYEYIGEVMDIVREKDAEDKCIVISFQIEALQEFRKYTDVIPMYYLMSKITDEKVEEVKALGNSGINFNANNDNNTQEVVENAIRETELDAACYTVDDLETVERMLEWGVTYITTNRLIP